jgi:ammonium transporter, Amt family
MTDILELCLIKEGDNVTDRILLQCALGLLQNNIATAVDNDEGNFATRTMLLIFAAACVFLMQAGFAMVCAGAVRKKNVQNTMLKNLLDACTSAFAFFAIGYAVAYGGSDTSSPTKTFMGTSNFFLMGVDDLAFWLFQFAFSAASATIVAGALAERCQMTAYIGYSLLVSGWVYPIVVHAIWDAQGFLSATNVAPLWGVGMIDYSGSGVVHITGGTTALIATTILGPRRGR